MTAAFQIGAFQSTAFQIGPVPLSTAAYGGGRGRRRKKLPDTTTHFADPPTVPDRYGRVYHPLISDPREYAAAHGLTRPEPVSTAAAPEPAPEHTNPKPEYADTTAVTAAERQAIIRRLRQELAAAREAERQVARQQARRHEAARATALRRRETARLRKEIARREAELLRIERDAAVRDEAIRKEAARLRAEELTARRDEDDAFMLLVA